MSAIDPPELVASAHAEPSAAVRAQLLATEHWSLLATRGLTWSEVMSRISIHLTVASASLVVLALVTQASRVRYGVPRTVDRPDLDCPRPRNDDGHQGSQR